MYLERKFIHTKQNTKIKQLLLIAVYNSYESRLKIN